MPNILQFPVLLLAPQFETALFLFALRYLLFALLRYLWNTKLVSKTDDYVYEWLVI